MADVKKSFQQDWVENTYTGRAVDAMTGGRLSAAGRKHKPEGPAHEGRESKAMERKEERREGREEVGLSDIREQYGKKGKRK